MKTMIPFLIVISIALGYAMSNQSASKTVPAEPVIAVPKETDNRLQTLIDQDYVDYLRLQKLEDRYKKADEILAKIMNVFLADLSLRISPEMKTAILKKTNPSLPNEPERFGAIALPSGAPLLTPQPNAVMYSQLSIDHPSKIEPFLKSMSKSTLKQDWVKAEFLKKEPAHLSGCFEGQGKLTEPNENWYVKMLHQFADGANGVISIQIAANGKQISNMSGKGNNSHIRGVDDQPDAIMLEANPDYVFQMFYIAINDSWAANIYHKQKDDTFKAVGTLELKRGTSCQAN